jgi:hypothetical protein
MGGFVLRWNRHQADFGAAANGGGDDDDDYDDQICT